MRFGNWWPGLMAYLSKVSAAGWYRCGSDYFVKDLAVEIGLPVLVVARNRLGCLNHTLLTVGSVQAADLRCAGVVLNSPSRDPDIAQTTNADILGSVLDIPLLPELAENTAELPQEWKQILGFSE